MYAVLVAHAPQIDITPYLGLIQRADLLLAADGGALALMHAGLLPQRVIGDLDSLDAHSEASLAERGVVLERYPREKDATDLELALMFAVDRGATTIDILGALGGRWDHTIANVALLALPQLQHCRVRLLSDDQELFVVRDQAVLEGRLGDTVSLLPLTAVVHGVTTQGLYYRLEGATLRFEQARGVSNILIEPPGEVRLREGMLLVVHHNDAGVHQWCGPR